MTVEVLISTMNQKNIKELVKQMNIQTDAIVINQCGHDSYYSFKYNKRLIRVFNSSEKGLSRSRNLALKNAKADICVIADDDMVYEDNYENIIINEYKNNESADILTFAIGGCNRKPLLLAKKINYLTSMKIHSVQMTLLRKKIIDKKLSFDVNFGAGSKLFMGEENIFLFDCLKNNVSIRNVTKKIANLLESESTWFRGFNKQYFKVKGAVYYRMSKYLYWFLIFQFVIRKYSRYKKEIGFFQALKYSFNGAFSIRRKNEG